MKYPKLTKEQRLKIYKCWKSLRKNQFVIHIDNRELKVSSMLGANGDYFHVREVIPVDNFTHEDAISCR